MDTRNVAIVLVVLGLVCVPAPLYLGGAGGSADSLDRTDYVYGADPVNTSDPEDVDAIIDAYGGGVLLSVHEVSAQHSSEYRAPDETRPLLTFAMRNDHATTTDADVQADLQYVEANYTYVHDATDDRERYYQVYVRSGGEVVQMVNASEQDVLDATLASTVVRYEDLSPRERTTFRNVLDASRGTTDPPGYRPYATAALLEHLPALVHWNGTLYDVRRIGPAEEPDAGGGIPVSPNVVAVVGGLLLALGFALFVGTGSEGNDGG